MLGIESILLSIFFEGNFISTTLGYIDPNSGTLVLQMIAGTLIGLVITIKIYWYKLKEKFTNIFKKDD